MLEKAETLALLMNRKPSHSLAQPFYTDPGIFEQDMQSIFCAGWLFAIPAFHNTCRHRGSRLCSARKGSAPRLVCPCHQWTCEPDGRLLFARDMAPDFDASKNGLKTVHCRELAGLVYICPADQAPDFEAFAQKAGAYLAPHDLSDARVAYESSFIENGNWKLVFENNRECCHCSGNHPALCRTFPDDPNAIGNNGEDNIAPILDNHIKRCEAVGARVPGAKLHFIVKKDDPFEEWTGYRGQLNQIVLGLVASDYLEREVYCCGPEHFMQAVRDILNALGYDMDRYHRESLGVAVETKADLPANDDLVPDDAIAAELYFAKSGVTAPCTQRDTVLAVAKASGPEHPLRLYLRCLRNLQGSQDRRRGPHGA